MGENIIIRRLVAEDAHNFYHLYQLEEIKRFLPDRFDSIEELTEIISWLMGNEDKLDFVRITRAVEIAGEFAGFVSIGPLPFDEKKREIAYALHPKFWGKGIGAAMVLQFIIEIFDRQWTDNLYAEVNVYNKSSISLLEKIGFRRLKEYFSEESNEQKAIYLLQRSQINAI